MADHPRIEELRRRVEKDPASIAFAQLGEEYRRAGNCAEAIRVCNLGLERHPGYLSARVTLGRALLEKNDLDNAFIELQLVLNSAPENLAAVRGLAEIYHRRGDLDQALVQYRVAIQLARHDPDIEETITKLERELNTKPKPAALSLEQVTAEFLSTFGEQTASATVQQNSAPPQVSEPTAASVVEPIGPQVLDPIAPPSVESIATAVIEVIPPPAIESNVSAPIESIALEGLELIAPMPIEPIAPPPAEPITPARVDAVAPPVTVFTPAASVDRSDELAALEQFLESIIAYRASFPTSAVRG